MLRKKSPAHARIARNLTGHTHLATKLLQNREYAFAEEQILDWREIGNDVFGAHQLLFATLVHLVIRHPFALLTGPRKDLVRPF